MTTDFLTLYNSEEADEIVSEDAFTPILKPFAGELLSLCHYVLEEDDGDGFTCLNMGILANVIRHASDVEHLMDRYRARNNRRYVYFRELAATAKNFGKAAFLLEELKKSADLHRFFLDGDSEFVESVESVDRLFAEVLYRNFLELQKEGRMLELEVPKGRPPVGYGVKLPNRIFLPHTIEESDSLDRMVTIKKFTQRHEEFSEEALRTLGGIIQHKEHLAAGIPEKVNEGTLRRLGTRLHNFLSWYDSHIAQSRIESEILELKRLRDIFPAQLNLFKIATILAHYYERHLLFPSSLIVDRLRTIVPSSQLIETGLYFCLYYIVELFHLGHALADSILDRLVDTVTYELPVPKTLGFHARPCTRVAKVVQHYGAHVKMLVDDQVFDAGSVIELLSAGGYILTKRLDRVQFRGDRHALDDLKILAEHNYGETFNGKDIVLPDALSYLG